MKTIQFNIDVIYCKKMADELKSNTNSNAEEKETRGTHIRERFMENDEVIGIIKRVLDICKDWMSLEADLETMTSSVIFLVFLKQRPKYMSGAACHVGKK